MIFIEEMGLLGLDIRVWFEKVTLSENVSLIKPVGLPDARIFQERKVFRRVCEVFAEHVDFSIF